MKTKEPKVHTLAQVAKVLGVTDRSVRNYVKAGLINATPWPKYALTVTDEELQRIKRDGVDTNGLSKKLAKRKTAVGKTAKKRAKP